MSGGNRETTQIVSPSARLRSDKIGQAMIELTRGFIHLLTERMEHRKHVRPRFLMVYLNIITHTISRPESVDSFGSDKTTVNDILEEFLRVFEQLSSLGSHLRIIENGRESPPHAPRTV